MSPEFITEAASLLRAARGERRRLDGLPERCRPRDMSDAYRIQDRLFELMAEPAYGWKIGATSRKARELVGIDSAICARMLASNCYDHPAELAGHFFFMRALESEFAFQLAADLPPALSPYDEQTVLAAIDSLHPAIEISDSRFDDWTVVGGPGLVADNANDGAFVLGEPVDGWQDLALEEVAVSLRRNEEVVARGSGAEVIGGPLGVLVWLANECARKGEGLRAGQVVTTGSCTGVVMAEPGDRICADFGRLGRVELGF